MDVPVCFVKWLCCEPGHEGRRSSGQYDQLRRRWTTRHVSLHRCLDAWRPLLAQARLAEQDDDEEVDGKHDQIADDSDVDLRQVKYGSAAVLVLLHICILYLDLFLN